jgi:hypothetical protein
MILANVIFPAPCAAYVASLFFPLSAILALAAECAIFIYFQRGMVSHSRVIGIVVAINLFSWVVGIALSTLLPTGLVPQLVGDGEHQSQIITTGPNWTTIAVLSFFWACLLSFGLEYGALKLLRRWVPLQNAAICTGLANVASYCCIAAVVAVHFYFDSF